MKKQPEHAKNFQGKAKNIPEENLFMLPYQSKWIRDESILKLFEKSRRVGVSFATSYNVVRRHSRDDWTQDTWCSSRDEPTARLFVSDCKGFTKVLKAAATDLGRRLIDKEGSYSLQFANHTEVNSVASNADVFAGKGGSVILDEFALRKDPRGVYAIASPTIDWGGGMEIVSTHRGSGNFYNKLIEEIRHKGNPKGFSLHRVTLQDALDQGFLWKLQTKLRENDPRMQMDEADYWNYQRGRCADEETFLQEYMCVPSDDASAFLPYDLIATCELHHPDQIHIDTEETRDFSGRKGSIRTLSLYTIDQIINSPFELYAGVDIGRDHDLTVIWLAGRALGMLMPLRIIEMSNVEFDRQEKELYELLRLPRMRRCCIDNTGIGKQFGERAQKRFRSRVEPVTFTAPVKEALAYPLRSAFEDRSIRVPQDDLVTSDLRAIKKETTAAGNIRFSADRGKNGHADRFWSLALAVHAATSPSALPYAPETRPPQAPQSNAFFGFVGSQFASLLNQFDSRRHY